MKLRWRNCQEVEEEHEADVRQYAHTFHYPQTICLAQAFWQLPPDHRDGIIPHEVGHLLAGVGGDERDANDAAQKILGARIEYVDSPWGRELERVMNMGAKIVRRNRNPLHHEEELPYGEWIPAHAVKFNHDGTVSLMTEGEENPIANVAGYKDPSGGFHPIRWDPDYDVEELKKEEPLYSTTHVGLPTRKVGGHWSWGGSKKRKRSRR